MFNLFKPKSLEPKTLGQIGEEIAQAEYKKKGFKIIAKNEYNKKGKRRGEIDFIATDRQSIIFVEVKTRVHDQGFFGSAVESVDHFKQLKILKAVKIFLLRNRRYFALKPQIDVCVMKITDFARLPLVTKNPAKYLSLDGVDKIPYSAKIIPNAVEDWN